VFKNLSHSPGLQATCTAAVFGVAGAFFFCTNEVLSDAAVLDFVRLGTVGLIIVSIE
jgi:hypothetical protein